MVQRLARRTWYRLGNRSWQESVALMRQATSTRVQGIGRSLMPNHFGSDLTRQFSACIEALTQPDAMRRSPYIEDVIAVDGNAGWRLFEAAAHNDLDAARQLLDSDANLVHTEYWYSYPVHMAVWTGNAAMTRFLLEHGSEPGRSRFMYYAWDKLLAAAQIRGFDDVHAVLVETLRERYAYHSDFDALVAQPIRDGDMARFDNALAARPELWTASDAFGNTGIHWAALTRQSHLVRAFLAHDADIDGRRADGRTPLLSAMSGDYWFRRHNRTPADEIVRALIDLGAKYTLTAACYLGDLDAVGRILNDDPKAANRLDSSRQSPLRFAASLGHTEIVRLLLASGADPNQPEDLAPQGRALFEASANNDLETAKALLAAGADPNAGADSSGTCLTIVAHKHPEACGSMQDLLRAYGAVTPHFALTAENLRERVRHDTTILEDTEHLRRFIQLGDPDLLRAALEAYPRLGERIEPHSDWPSDEYPETVAQFELLMRHGLDIRRRDWLGKTFLHTAAQRGDVEMARFFLDAGIDVNSIELWEFKTPLAEAALQGRQEMAAFLIEQGADVDFPREVPPARPLARAIAAGHDEIADMLRTYGAEG